MNKKTYGWLVCLLVMLVGTLALTARRLPAQEPRLVNADLYVVRVYFDDVFEVSRFSAEKEPWRVDFQAHYFNVDMTQAEIAHFQAQGFRVEIDADATAGIRRPVTDGAATDTIPGFSCYRTVEETFASAQSLVNNHPDLAQWVDVGNSWEKTQNPLLGYDLMVLRLTNFNLDPTTKPKLFITASIHAREYAPAELVTRFGEYLVTNYGVDPDITWLLDYHDIHLMLQANPDGRKKAETGLLWRKNTNNNYCSNTNDRGADLNRNFVFQWGCCGGSSGQPCAETYRGPFAGSEPETQAIMNYMTAIFPDQRGPGLGDPAPADATGVYIDVHSYSQLVLWPWGFTGTPAPNSTALRTLGRKMAYFNNYYPEQAIGLYPTDGTTDDHAYGQLGVAGYTYEVGTNFFEACSSFEGSILPTNLQALLYAAKVARTPYLTPAGPDTLSPDIVGSDLVPAGTPAPLTATINDTRYNNQNGTEPTQAIQAAEYYVDTPPWVTDPAPVAYPMVASDGNFNSAIEAAQASIDTTGLTTGRHIVFARGRDVGGNWGPVSAVFLTVFDPAVAPTIQGVVTAGDTGQPLAATLKAGAMFQTVTDPVTGFYQMQVLSNTYALQAIPDSADYGSKTVTVTAHDYETIQQDFVLYPYCTVYSTDVESGNNVWTPQAPWVVSVERFHSPVHAWTDSPGGNYAANRNITLTSPAFDFSDYDGVQLVYWQVCDTAAGDYCRVEVSPDNGVNWEEIGRFNGAASSWQKIVLAASQLDGQPAARMRFHFTSDASYVDDGWHIDDISLLGAGAACLPDEPPVASFTSTSPDALGQNTQFTDTSVGANLTYAWGFGDGSPIAVEANPTHLYALPGSYTVTLTVTNEAGNDTATGTVTILTPPLAGFTSSSPDPLGATTAFANTSTGDALSYAWDFGDGSPIAVAANPTHVYALPGSYPAPLTAPNAVGADAATSIVTILTPPLPAFTSPTPHPLGTTTVFSNTSTGDALSYAWDFGDGSPIAAEANPTHQYAFPGRYTVTLTATNAVGADTATGIVTILTPPQAGFLTSSPDQLGATTVFTNTSTGDALSYAWDFGDHSEIDVRENPTHVYATPGQYWVTLTVTNAIGSDTVTAMVEILPAVTPRFYFYLPILVHKQP